MSVSHGRIETFDDFNSSLEGTDISQIVPMQYLPDDADMLQWLNEFFDISLEASRSRFEAYEKYLNLYKGVHWKGDVSTKRNPKQSVNFIFELTEDKVSMFGTKKIGLQAVPEQNTQTSVNNAKAAKILLDARLKKLDFDSLTTDFDRTMLKYGHAFYGIDWNDMAGGMHPIFKKARELGEGFVKKAAKKIGTDKVFIGDVDVNVISPNRVFPELGKKKLHKDVDYVDIVELVQIEELKFKYPEFADEIQASPTGDMDWCFDEYKNASGYVVLHRTIHRVTENMLDGREIIWTRDVILEDKPLKYRHGMIPLVDDRDITIDEEFFGRSNYCNVHNLQRFYNVIQSSQARDFTIASAPKWMVPKGSIKASAINSDLSLMEYTGPTAPKLVSHSPASAQGFNLQDRIEAKIQKSMRVGDIERGEVPAGVTANSALRFLDEKEQTRLSTAISQRNGRIVRAYNMVMDTMAQFYKVGDGRTVRALGEDNSYLIKDLSKTDFTQVYSIDIQKSSALPDTKTGRIGAIVDLNQVTQTDPVFKRDEIIDMLDLGLDKAFVNRSTVSINAARAILQDILEGNEVAEPKMSDGLITHYKVFTDAIEENWFKQRVDPAIEQILADRIMTIEGMMWIKAKDNAKFAQEVGLLDKYPIYFRPNPTISQLIMMHQQQPAQPAPQQTEHIDTTQGEQ